MQDADLSRALKFVLDHEGRVDENVSGDPGGKTHWGVTQADYNAYRREHGLPWHDVFGMTDAEVQAVYREHYWTPMHCPELCAAGHYGVALALFDAAVNCGAGRATCWTQGVCGLLQDGGFGPVTIAAVNRYIDVHGGLTFALALLVRRREYYNRIGAPGKALNKFLKGWLNRCADLQAEVVRLAASVK